MSRIDRTPHPPWIEEMLPALEPLWQRVVRHQYFLDMASGSLSELRFHRGLIYFYPLIETFPRYMALTLTKVPPGDGGASGVARRWLLANMNVERVHAKLWRQWAVGFGVPGEVFDRPITPPAPMDAINSYLWRVCSHGSLVEAVAATNYAIEGVTGDWTKGVVHGLASYGPRGFSVSKRSLAWVRAHADYDDAHPWEALEIIKAFAVTPESQAPVQSAIARALEYYAMALDSCHGAASLHEGVESIVASEVSGSTDETRVAAGVSD
jgi:pyrroloquinoline quinone (PQQ) biosynthesis protein C